MDRCRIIVSGRCLFLHYHDEPGRILYAKIGQVKVFFMFLVEMYGQIHMKDLDHAYFAGQNLDMFRHEDLRDFTPAFV